MNERKMRQATLHLAERPQRSREHDVRSAKEYSARDAPLLAALPFLLAILGAPTRRNPIEIERILVIVGLAASRRRTP